MPGERRPIHPWHPLNFQELADEASRDLLQKHGRPTELKTVHHSAGVDAVVEKPRKKVITI
jgi:hypothetical protein